MKRLLIISSCALLLAGCKSVRYIEVPTHDTLYSEKWQVDTTYIERTRYVDRKGDTVHIVDTVIVYRATHSRDTVREVEVRTVPKPYPVTKEVEKPLRWWQKVLMWLGGIAAAYAALKIYLRVKN